MPWSHHSPLQSPETSRSDRTCLARGMGQSRPCDRTSPRTSSLAESLPSATAPSFSLSASLTTAPSISALTIACLTAPSGSASWQAKYVAIVSRSIVASDGAYADNPSAPGTKPTASNAPGRPPERPWAPRARPGHSIASGPGGRRAEPIRQKNHGHVQRDGYCPDEAPRRRARDVPGRAPGRERTTVRHPAQRALRRALG